MIENTNMPWFMQDEAPAKAESKEQGKESDDRWMQEPPTQKQISFLVKCGCKTEGLTRGQAKELIYQKIEEQGDWRTQPASKKQLQFLKWKRANVSPDLTKGEAAEMITEIKRVEDVSCQKTQTRNP